MKTEELTNLDTLRSLAILLVLIDHLVPTLATHLGYQPQWLVRSTMHIGQAGVLAFFVHTSLVLMMSLERLGAKQGGQTIRFYVRRAFRIAPLAWFTIALVVAAGLPSNVWRQPDPISWQVVVSNMTFVQNVWTKKQVIQPLWSLAYEMQMYVVLPVLFWLVTRVRGIAILLALIGASVLGGAVLAQITGGRLNMAAYLPCFMSGVLAYRWSKELPQILPARLWLPFLLIMTAAFVAAHQDAVEPIYWIGWIYCFVLGVAIPRFRNDEPSTAQSRVAHSVAKYSYGLYLLHVPALYFVFVFLDLQDVGLAALVFFGVSWVFAYAAFHLIEKPMMDLGKRVTETKKP